MNSCCCNRLTNVHVVQDSSQSSMAKEAEGSVGMDVSQLARAASHAQPYPRVDSQGQILSADALKLRGMHAAQYHKTSIEAMLHSTHAGATPYRTVLGDVRLHLCTQLCPVMSVRCLFVHPYICPSVSSAIMLLQLHALLFLCALPHFSNQYILPHQSPACMTHNSHRQ